MLKYYLGLASLLILDRFLKIFFLKTLSAEDGVFALYINKNIAFSLPVPVQVLYPLLFLVFQAMLFVWNRELKTEKDKMINDYPIYSVSEMKDKEINEAKLKDIMKRM
jgi:hypothetical protein